MGKDSCRSSSGSKQNEGQAGYGDSAGKATGSPLFTGIRPQMSQASVRGTVDQEGVAAGRTLDCGSPLRAWGTTFPASPGAAAVQISPRHGSAPPHARRPHPKRNSAPRNYGNTVLRTRRRTCRCNAVVEKRESRTSSTVAVSRRVTPGVVLQFSRSLENSTSY
jgi:hypothetical protein